jgi:putative membrane protein
LPHTHAIRTFSLSLITTAGSTRLKPFAQNRLLQGLIGAFAVLWVWSAINPAETQTWLLENILVVAAIAGGVWIVRRQPLSDVSYLLCAAFLMMHVVGSHYTYSLVPFGEWMKIALGFERNHYDRLIHFGFGLLLTYPLRELLVRMKAFGGRWPGVVAFLIVSTASGAYELMEWLAAVIVDPEAGTAFLGTQGDEFDSQKDHALACGGALITLVLTRIAEGTSPARSR